MTNQKLLIIGATLALLGAGCGEQQAPAYNAGKSPQSETEFKAPKQGVPAERVKGLWLMMRPSIEADLRANLGDEEYVSLYGKYYDPLVSLQFSLGLDNQPGYIDAQGAIKNLIKFIHAIYSPYRSPETRINIRKKYLDDPVKYLEREDADLEKKLNLTIP